MTLSAAVACALLAMPISADDTPKGKPAVRTFQFTYATTVTGLPPGKTARIWLPVPPSNDEQQVRVLKREAPVGTQTAKEPTYGNEILFLEASPNASGSVHVAITYELTRREVRGETPVRVEEHPLLARFLQADSKVPIDGKPLSLVQGQNIPRDQFAAAKVFYDAVNSHMKYSKDGVGWGQGDSNWACDSKFGNCSDFHSLFISLSRSRKIPAKFEMGFPIPEKRGEGEVGGYHCWAKFRPEGKGWVPVDISEANKNPKLRDYYFGNLTEDRVAFSTGRDINLVPKQSTGPLNFFIYPHVEVDGKVWPAEKIQRKFSYKDVAAGK